MKNRTCQSIFDQFIARQVNWKISTKSGLIFLFDRVVCPKLGLVVFLHIIMEKSEPRRGRLRGTELNFNQQIRSLHLNTFVEMDGNDDPAMKMSGE